MDYSKPLMDPMTVNMLRLYGYGAGGAASIGGGRERSASEASSVASHTETPATPATPQPSANGHHNSNNGDSASTTPRHNPSPFKCAATPGSR